MRGFIIFKLSLSMEYNFVSHNFKLFVCQLSVVGLVQNDVGFLFPPTFNAFFIV